MKVAIVGSEQHTRHLAPFDNPDFKIWVFNEFANAEWCKRWDLLFQLHDPKIYRNLNNEKDPHHWEWLQQRHDKPVVMQKIDPLVPDSTAYPLREVLEMMDPITYQGQKQKYLRSTISYALAMAILMPFVEEIHIYGVELASTAEYRSQQANFAFWMGVAAGRNKAVVLHCCQWMFNQPLYGFEEFMQEDKIQRYVEGLNQQREEILKQLHMIEGALTLAMQMLNDEKKEAEGVKETQG